MNVPGSLSSALQTMNFSPVVPCGPHHVAPLQVGSTPGATHPQQSGMFQRRDHSIRIAAAGDVLADDVVARLALVDVHVPSANLVFGQFPVGVDTGGFPFDDRIDNRSQVTFGARGDQLFVDHRRRRAITASQARDAADFDLLFRESSRPTDAIRRIRDSDPFR